MKKTLLLIIACVAQQWLHAQVEVNTKSFELESINKHKGWFIVDAGKDSVTNKVFVKFAQSVCDQTNNIWTGTRTFRGLKWNIDKVIFDNQFGFESNLLTNYNSSEEAIFNNEFVFGKTYTPMPTNIGKSMWQGGASITRPLNNAFMFKNVVTGTAGISGFKVNVSSIGCQPLVRDTKYSGTLCGETSVVETISSTDAKEEKSQRWIPMYNNPVPNGGNILFNTVGVGPENKQHYVFRKYNENGGVVNEISLSFDYQCLPTVKEIEKTPGVFDYVIVMTPINYKKSKLTVAPANQYEYIKIDGETFKVTEQTQFTAPNSQWIVNDVIMADGAVYLAGLAGAKNTVYKDFALPKTKEYTTYQVAKIANGKLQYISNTTLQDAQAILAIAPGIKGNVKATFHNTSIKLYVINGKLLVSAQNFLAGKYGALVTMVFDQNGKLETYLAKPEKIIARASLHFTANGKTAYWVLQDLGQYNKFDSKTGVLTAKKVKFLANALAVVKFDLETKQVANLQSFVNDEWALDYNNTQLYETATELVLMGKKLTKKAKESEIVFVTLKK